MIGRFWRVLTASFWMIACMQAAYADDTEIFFPSVSGGANANVMFVIDTSRSMLFDAGVNGDGSVPTSYKDYPNSRLQIVKEVITELIDEMAGFNVGLATFSRPSHKQGGAILAPIADLNSQQTPYLLSEVTQSGDDGSFAAGGAGGTVSLKGEALTFGEVPSVIRFANISLPKGALIKNAKLSFVAKSDIAITNANQPTIEIRAQIYDKNKIENGIVDLSTTATNSVDWTLAHWKHNDTYFSPDLKSLVGPLVKDADLCAAEQSLLFQLKGKSGGPVVSAYSYEGVHAYYKAQDSHVYDVIVTPRLQIEYEMAELSCLGEPKKYTHRDFIKNTVRHLISMGGNTIPGALDEVIRYFSKGAVNTGAGNEGTQDIVSNPLTYTGTVSGTAADPIYNGITMNSCANNYVVFVTDGLPNSGAAKQVETDYDCKGSEECILKLVEQLYKTDFSKDIDGLQNVVMRMIKFTEFEDSNKLLEKVAQITNSQTLSATNKAELKEAFVSVFTDVARFTGTFATAGVSVDQVNRISHKSDLYFSLFNPVKTNAWQGNIKKYGLVDGRIVDANNKLVVDEITGLFKSEAKSFWSTKVDGNETEKGGAASHLPKDRALFSNLQGNKNINLNIANNRVSRETITKKQLGISGANGDEVFKKSIDWALGYDVEHPDYDSANLSRSPAHRKMSDPLHSQPNVVSYQNGKKEQAIVYVGTNDGMLHAIDAATGEELWAYIPHELLVNLPKVMANNQVGTHTYGLDGAMTVYLKDDNSNGVVDSDEKAYLYIGMRRGGRSYYALDISNPKNPKLQFIISGNKPDQLGKGLIQQYKKLGQTWSKPVVTPMKIKDEERLVMVFGGGYNPEYDDNYTVNDSAMGGAVYVADALTGELLWSSKLPMNAVAADVTVIDLDGDSRAEYIYVVDIKGQVFRIDIEDTASSGLPKETKVAILTGDKRRFYSAIDAAKVNLIGNSYVSLSLGSGFRGHPLNTDIRDHFYMIKDYQVLQVKRDEQAPVTLGDLTDVTEIGTKAGDKGWYVQLEGQGEKVLQSSITFNNVVVFTTYLPPQAGAISAGCSAGMGSSRVYQVKVTDGMPTKTLASSSTLTQSDRYQALLSGSIASQPQIMLEETDEGIETRLCVGTQCNLTPPLSPKGLVGYKWSNTKYEPLALETEGGADKDKGKDGDGDDDD